MPSLLISRAARFALDLLYPPRCALCGQGGVFVCAACLEALPRALGPRCDRCWLPDAATCCQRCETRPLAFDRLRSAFRYEGGVRRLVRSFKFRGESALAETLAGQLVPLLSDLPDLDVLTPVPLTGGRERERGYNQAGLLAKALAREAGLPVVEALRRTRSASPQARSASAFDRFRNVEGAFAVRLPAVIARKRVLLVDDVATTGATLDACANALLAAGAACVSALTLARED